MTVTIISMFLSSMLAIPKLRETAKLHGKVGRLVITGTVGHIFSRHDQLLEPGSGEIFTSLDDEKAVDVENRYHLSKLIAVLCVHGLATELSHSEK
jgi:hypothetical protein